MEYYELKNVNRFLVRFPDNFGIPDWTIITCTPPSKQFDGQIKITTRYPVVLDNYGVDDEFKLNVDYLTETGTVNGGYKLNGCKIVGVDNVELDYENDGIVRGIIHVSYRYCESSELITITPNKKKIN